MNESSRSAFENFDAYVASGEPEIQIRFSDGSTEPSRTVHPSNLHKCGMSYKCQGRQQDPELAWPDAEYLLGFRHQNGWITVFAMCAQCTARARREQILAIGAEAPLELVCVRDCVRENVLQAVREIREEFSAIDLAVDRLRADFMKGKA